MAEARFRAITLNEVTVEAQKGIKAATTTFREAETEENKQRLRVQSGKNVLSASEIERNVVDLMIKAEEEKLKLKMEVKDKAGQSYVELA